MVAGMEHVERRTPMWSIEWSELGVSQSVPTGTVTLLLGEVEASTQLWDCAPSEMTAAIAKLNAVVCRAVASHGGVRPVEQGAGDSVVAAFARASDAVACALELQKAPLAPIRLRIGVHTGEVQLRGAANHAGDTINRAVRLRDLAHGGQTVLSRTTAELVLDRLPDGAWLMDLGTQHLRDLARPEAVMQLCHPAVRNDFPPLRADISVGVHNLPAQITRFVGRDEEIDEVRRLLGSYRLVTLTGAGGVGKTRLSQHLSAQLVNEFSGGLWYVDLAPISGADILATTVARALGLCDQPGRSAIDKITTWVGTRHVLIVVDNCEHVLDACAALISTLLAHCSALTVLATSREPLGVAGEVIWRVPSLPIASAAIELFVDRARLAQPDFHITDDNATVIKEICQRLDGMPLAIELAAARVRASSLVEILEGLHDRFRLLIGGARTAAERQQTLRASLNWSHALLSEPERVLFRRLAVFMGGFDLNAAQVVAGSGELERYSILEQLSLLVDKSLVLAENCRNRTRYRMLETMRQYAQEKLGDSDEAETIHTRHRDHYSGLAAMFETLAPTELEQHAQVAETEIDNLRAAFTWSIDKGDPDGALALASHLQPLWRRRGRTQEGLAWLDAALTNASAQAANVTPAMRARALADRVMLNVLVDPAGKGAATEAVKLAREIGDPALLLRALSAWCCVAAYNAETAEASFAEALGLARSLCDLTALSQLLPVQAFAALVAGDPHAQRAAAEEGCHIARAIGDEFTARHCNWNIAMSHLYSGELDTAIEQFNELTAGADAHHDPVFGMAGRFGLSIALAFRGETTAAHTNAAAAVEQAVSLGDLTFMDAFTYAGLALAALARGDVAAATEASEIARQRLNQRREFAALYWNPIAEVALASGDLATARRHADEFVAATSGVNASMALTTRARIAAAQADFAQAESDGRRALVCASKSRAYLAIPDALECLASVAGQRGDHQEAARLFGAAQGIRNRTGQIRFAIYDRSYQASVAELHEALGHLERETLWAQGAALSTEEALLYAQRGRGARKRPSRGWSSLTPSEQEIVRLVCAGLANKDVAAKLFISPRTVQTHLTHIYRKIGVKSRTQLAQQAASNLS